MDFHFSQRVRLGLGVSQQVGLLARELGSRALILTEGVYSPSKELAMITQSLDRAQVSYLILEQMEGQAAKSFTDEAVKLGRAGYLDVVIALGSVPLLCQARAAAVEIPKGAPPKTKSETGTKNWKDEKQEKPTAGLPYLEIPSVPVFPLLLREETFIQSKHPGELKFINTPLFHKHRIFLDPHMATGQTPRSSVTALLQGIFCATEVLFHEQCQLMGESLILGALESLWQGLGALYENPANVNFRFQNYQAGLNLALAMALVPRAPGLQLDYTLTSLSGLPSSTLGSVFLAPFIEMFTAKVPGRLEKLARALGVSPQGHSPEALAKEVGDTVRTMMHKFELPMRLSDFRLVESEVNLAADMLQGASLHRGSLLTPEAAPDFLRSTF